MKRLFLSMLMIAGMSLAYAEDNAYKVGVEDVLEVSVLQPEQLSTIVAVAPDGSITFPYIGTVNVNDMTLARIQETVQAALADGYMKYPVVAVSLKESRSKKFFVYGEVIRPGTYLHEDNMTALRAITVAGGFSKFGAADRIKLLRPQTGDAGYEVIKINLKDVIAGKQGNDVKVRPGDIIVVGEGVF
jgi:polysaccharide export outer membrane protein